MKTRTQNKIEIIIIYKLKQKLFVDISLTIYNIPYLHYYIVVICFIR